MVRYKSYRPDHYPIAWITAATKAFEIAQAVWTGNPEEIAQGPWISADWARGEAGAVNRMKRLRAFRDALRNFPHDKPALTKAAKSWELQFRKVPVQDVWDVQLRWVKPGISLAELAEAAKKADPRHNLAKIG